MIPQQKLVHELHKRFRWPCSLVVKQAPDKSCSGCSIQSSATIFHCVFRQLCVLSQDSKATDCKPVMRWCKSISTLYTGVV